jgi:DNA helicase-2/ATP-dependent DNA helicase PcrA
MTETIIEDVLRKPGPLSKEQTAAVTSNSRFVRIVADAGAGKTEVLMRRIAYLLLVKGVEPSSIVVFTFTEGKTRRFC